MVFPQLQVWLYEPFLEETVVGCFVRVAIGMADGQQVYRMCEVVGLQEGRTYSIEQKKTNKWLLLRHGTNERLFRMDVVSNRCVGRCHCEGGHLCDV